MEDEKNMTTPNVIKSDNTQGNPYHEGKGSPEGGQFTSKEDASNAGIDTDVPQKKTVKTFGDFLNKIGFKKKSEQEQKEYELKKKNVQGLMKNPSFDKAKLMGLTNAELEEVQNAVITCENKEQTIFDELQEYNHGAVVGLWLDPKFPSDYKMLKNSGSFDKKKKYFEDIFMGPESKKQEMLNALNDFQIKGEKYIQEKLKLEDKYKPYEELIAKYQDDSPYTQARKDAAMWISNKDFTGEVQAVIDNIGKKTNAYMSNLKKEDYTAYSAMVDYTGAYSWITNTLRNKPYGGSYGKGTMTDKFVSTVKAMDRALDSSTYDQDIWVRRGVDNLMINNLSGALGMDLANLPMKDLSTLAGTCFKDQSFVSCGGSKHTGFGSKSIDMYIYCPKGTNMLHMAQYSSYYSENEFVLARGYTYRITKAYMKGGTITIDCEVLLGSNQDRHSDDKLQQLANKNL